jgi:hypothetical protein
MEFPVGSFLVIFLVLLLVTTGGLRYSQRLELDSPTFVNEFATLALGFALLGSRALQPLTVLLWFCVSGLGRCVS